MLDLPTWLAVTRVYCNKAAIRIQWTKLKTSPICLFLDKVEVEMRTCEEPRPPNGPSPIAITAGQSEYGFAEKVVEGMSVRINTITIQVHARAFHASFELWQLQGNSLNPQWQRSDLRNTRVSDPQRGEVLTFKEINWQTLRIEADAIEGNDQDLGSTPLRLITNQGRIRIALKRRMKDCNVLASKLLFILDDLLWVLTDSQLKAIVHYAKSLSDAMERSAQQRKSRTAASLQTAPPSPGLHSLWSEPPPAPTSAPTNMSQYFDLYDVKESSYHTFISRLDLHICNDSSSADGDEAPPPGMQGAMQLTFRKLGFDFYPVHRPADGCRHWERHNGAMEAQAQWAAKLLQEHQRRAEASGFPGPHSEGPQPTKEAPPRAAPEGPSSPKWNASRPPQTSRRNSRAASGSRVRRLRSSCVVVRMDDINVHQVSTRGRQNKKTQSLLSCSRKALNLAENVPAVHLQFTEYYCPDTPDTPGTPGASVPTPSLYAQLNGLTLCVDPPSVVWISLFSRGLLHTLDQVKAFYHLQDSSRTEEHLDVRVDGAQLKVVFPLDSSILEHPERPRSLCLSAPQATLSNTRLCPHGSRADLLSTLLRFSSCPFFQAAAAPPFPRDRRAFQPLPAAFLHHAQESEAPPLDGRRLRSQDVWALSLSRVGLGFNGARLPPGRSHAFVEPFSVSVWACQPSACQEGPPPPPSGARPPPSEQTDGVCASIHILVHAVTPLRLWLNHYQYVALLRMRDALSRLGGELSHAQSHVTPAGGQKPSSACVSLLMDSAEVGLLLPPVPSELGEEVPPTPETDTPSVSDSDVSPTCRSVDVGVEESGVENGVSSLDELDGGVEEACEALEEGAGPDESPALSAGPSPALSREPSAFSLEGELSSAISVTKDATRDALSASLGGALSLTRDAFSLLGRGGGVGRLFSPQGRDPLQRSDDLRPPLKPSFSQHSFDSAVLDGSLPDDSQSLDGDAEGLMVLMEPESGVESLRPDHTPAAPGSPAPGTEGGSSADLSSSLSQSTEDMSQDEASVLLLLLRGAVCSLEVRGEDQAVSLEVQSLTPQQMGNVRLSELQAGLTHAPATPIQKPGDRKSPALCLRAEAGPESAGLLEAGLRDCRAELLASTLANIGPFLEDEFSADGQPIRLQMSNVSVTVTNDGPKVYPTAPQPVPASFRVDQLLLERGDDGVMRLTGPRGASDPEASVGAPGGASDSDGSCSALQRRALESQLSAAQAALSEALGDKQRLLLEIRRHDPTFTL
ncbi:bridge-like lipid transfer protein family member 3A isoform X2 [Antennarius striatus]